ncbi:MAG: pitrilysin family protein [Polyangiales bacterium]
MSRGRTRAPEGGTLVAGMPLFLEESRALPLVDLELVFRTGSALDPEGKEGVTRLLGRMCRMGTKKLRGHEVEERVSALGGRLSIDVSTSYLRVHGTVIRRNLEPFVELVASLVSTPALRVADLAHVKREAEADRIASFDNDRGLVARHFRKALFRDHPYGRSVVGTKKSLRGIDRSDLVEFHQANFVRGNLLVGAAGDIDLETFAPMVERYLADLPDGTARAARVPATKQRRGMHLLVVDKPQRSQTQILVGTLGSRFRDPLTFPLLVANTAFGGMFTGRLMHEIRTVRGLSYGASSRIGQDHARDAFSMYTFPTASETASTVELMLSLYRQFVVDGISDAEAEAAKQYLANSRCFEEDTAHKRLDALLDAALFGLPSDHYTRFAEHVRAVEPEVARSAIRERLSTRDLQIVVVATASEVQSSLSQLGGLTSIEVVPYDADV